LIIAAYVIPSLLVLAAAPWFGGEDARWPASLGRDGQHWSIPEQIFLFQRVPRILLGFLAGGTLGLAGAVLQVLLRNPLAEPFTLGITGGAALGAAMAITIPGLFAAAGPLSTVQIFALAGSGLSLFIIYALARSPRGISMNTLLLAGVTIGILSNALILLIRYLVSPHLLLAVDRWLMGGLDIVGFNAVASLLPLLLPGAGLMLSTMTALNHLSLGEDLAAGHGVDVAQIQRRAFFGAGLATAAVVSVAGPIGFIGLITPHAVRKLSGYDHRIVLPGAFCLGGMFLVACDVLARTVAAPMEMPVGIVTALIGGPLFIFLLVRTRN